MYVMPEEVMREKMNRAAVAIALDTFVDPKPGANVFCHVCDDLSTKAVIVIKGAASCGYCGHEVALCATHLRYLREVIARYNLPAGTPSVPELDPGSHVVSREHIHKRLNRNGDTSYMCNYCKAKVEEGRHIFVHIGACITTDTQAPQTPVQPDAPVSR